MTDTDLQQLRDAVLHSDRTSYRDIAPDLAALGRVGERIRELEGLVARSPQNGETRAEFGPGLPPAGGWKRHMVEDPEYSPEFQDEYRRLWHRDAARVAVLEEALREIGQGAGAFSSDPFEHAVNTIAEMKETARAVLAVVPGELDGQGLEAKSGNSAPDVRADAASDAPRPLVGYEPWMHYPPAPRPLKDRFVGGSPESTLKVPSARPAETAETRADAGPKLLGELHPAAFRCWQRVNAVMPPSDPSQPGDPSVSLDTLAAILHVTLSKLADAEEALARIDSLTVDRAEEETSGGS